MDHFTKLKRRTTDLLQSLPENLPSPPKTSFGHVFKSSSATAAADNKNTLKGTWQRIALPPLPRSSHSINVVAGTAYIFGGEGASARQPVDNAMHAIVLPTGSANADYYAIPAKPAKTSESPETAPKLSEPVPSPATDPIAIAEPETASSSDEEEEDDDDEEEEEDSEEEDSDDDSDDDSSTATPTPKNKGKGKEPEAVDEIPLPGPTLGSVPAPRVGHATAVIGNRIFLFGGRGGPDGAPLDERGRVWVFDTKAHTWSYLDPAVQPAVFPAARSYHAAAASETPTEVDEFGPPRRAASWKQWVEGDMADVGTPQRPIVGNIAERARDADSDGYGTLFIHGGCLAAGGSRTSDVWAFDVRTRAWSELPAAPGLPRAGAALCISRNRRLYRYGGFNGSSEEGGRLDFLPLELSSPDDSSVEGAGAAPTLSASGAWQSIVPETKPSTTQVQAVGTDSGAPLTASATSSPAPVIAIGAAPDWPGDRSVASLEAITTGGGWEYLVLALGERTPSGTGKEAAGTFWSDVWTFQVPSDNLSAASVTNAVRQVLPRRFFGGKAGAGEGHWSRVVTAPYDADDAGAAAVGAAAAAFGPGARGWFASAPMRELEENAIVVFGGVDDKNQRLGDGWIFRLGGETRE